MEVATLTRWLPSFTKQAPPSSSRLTANLRRASALSEESFSLYERSGDKAGMALALINLGDVVRERGDEKRAAAPINDALSLHRELGNERGDSSRARSSLTYAVASA